MSQKQNLHQNYDERVASSVLAIAPSMATDDVYDSEQEHHNAQFDADDQRFQYAIVWTHLPPITWILPFIGHMGICDSRGVIYDFVGGIGKGDMMLGPPCRYLRLDPLQARKGTWDAAVHRANDIYEHRIHNICCDNCHSHVAVALEQMKYRAISHWNMVVLCFWVFFTAPYTSFCAFLKQWTGFAIIVLLYCFA